ncbi:MAG: hypothetical protein OHK93_001014 [Ramalina farinacea]|uniref:Tho complex subunit 7 n=1 Tax=Ramalina farinacea TaxID=258253 RepID=A0AA43QNM9_9LECA|nr:hypothetical protein [Ramalina farinacea]
MASHSLLDQAEEDALHKARLLNVEEKPFKRITKRLLAHNALISAPITLPPTPPPDANAADEEAAAHEHEMQRQLDVQRQWREDVLLDFAAFESSILRIQFLLTSNIKQRDHYAAEKIQIENTAQAVRDNTVDLRNQLQEAQQTLALRKEYDELAEKITSNRLLKPREEQQQNLEKLHNEIAELERESTEYARTWAERREQFGRIIEEGMQMRRLIRDEKEEVERREGMEGQGDGDDDQKSRASGRNTPRPESMGENTPTHRLERDGDVGSPATLNVDRGEVRGSSPLREVQSIVKTPDEEDEEMAEDGELAAESENMTADPVEGLIASEGEEADKPGSEAATDRMDVT